MEGLGTAGDLPPLLLYSADALLSSVAASLLFDFKDDFLGGCSSLETEEEGGDLDLVE